MRPDAPALLKAATRRLVTQAGGAAAAAVACDTQEPSIAQYCGQAYPHRFIRADQVAILEEHAEQPHVTAMLASLAGYRLVRQVADGGGGVVALADLLAGSGEAIAAGARGLADGRLTACERRELLPLVQRLATLAAAAEAALSTTERE
jgi:hypothetical protein